jgi:hypothetical protein
LRYYAFLRHHLFFIQVGVYGQELEEGRQT